MIPSLRFLIFWSILQKIDVRKIGSGQKQILSSTSHTVVAAVQYPLSSQSIKIAAGYPTRAYFSGKNKGIDSTIINSIQRELDRRKIKIENVTKRYFAEGEQRIGEKGETVYYYSRDHLGSIREVTDAAGNLIAQYDYDAWGKRVTISGNPNFDFGFTGHYFHQPSGLNLTMYRAYNPTLGRWISKDPIGERAGINLYE